MKRFRFGCVLAALLLLCAGCKKNSGSIFDHTTPYEPPLTETTAAPETEAPSESAPQDETTAPAVAPQTEAPASETAPPETGVDLSIEMPAANGTMQVSTDPENEYIRLIRDARGLDPSLLAAVFTVPQTGQNYVFEFAGAARTADDIRRVYLIDETGAVKSVAAADAAERENISVTENWFCMNVLIKGVVFPAVRDQF